jgi:arginine-tRNA-protein transferase
MQELLRIIEEPRQCSYLPDETASLEIRLMPRLKPDEFGRLLARGYRRFGWQVFRPACPSCSECRSLRVLVQQYEPGASARRVLRKNEAIRAELHPLFVTREHVELYNAYHRYMRDHRDWPFRVATASSYHEDFLSGSNHLGRQWLYFDKDRLVGVALMDEAPDAISLVYFFHDPDWRERSPGTFSILTQLDYARRRNVRYAYLGYCVAGCPSLSYKSRFRPHETLTAYPRDGEAPVWK